MLADIVTTRVGQPVHCLAFHVDYWDYLGWRDPFADPQFSRRQRAYGAAFKQRSTYTPQMIVNGVAQFVGSRRQEAESKIDAALEVKATEWIELRIELHQQGEPLQVNFKLKQAKAGRVLHMALVESHLRSRIRGGENSGQTLIHVNVVRTLHTVDVSRQLEGSTRIQVPNDLSFSDSHFVGYVQDLATMQILGAACCDLPSHPHSAGVDEP